MNRQASDALSLAALSLFIATALMWVRFFDAWTVGN
jgi:hypothetical protein